MQADLDSVVGLFVYDKLGRSRTDGRNALLKGAQVDSGVIGHGIGKIKFEL